MKKRTLKKSLTKRIEQLEDKSKRLVNIVASLACYNAQEYRLKMSDVNLFASYMNGDISFKETYETFIKNSDASDNLKKIGYERLKDYIKNNKE